jgi:putative FmdB family regulatory protein
MPIYEYRCKACGQRFEALRPVGDRGRSLICPECGEKGPEKLPSVFAASTGCGPAGGGFT